MAGVYAVVLTFNRKDLLRRCLDAVRAQTIACDAVIVIDNGGTDGTAEMIGKEYPWVELCQLHRNVGAAGGFNVGMRLAVAAGAKLAWVMDDDVIPDVDALAELLKGLSLSRNGGLEPPFVISIARTPDGELTNVPDIDQRTNALRYGIWPMLLEHGMSPVLRATFVSILLPRETLLTHGYPIAAMFIWGEDTEFTLRVTRRAPGFLCGSSRVTHVRATAGSLDIRFEKAIHRMSWHKCLVRNDLYVARRYRTTLVVLVRIARWLKKAVQLAAIGELRKAWIILTGVVSGIFFRPRTHTLDGDELGTKVSYISASLHARIAASCSDGIPRWVTADNMLQMSAKT